MTCCTGVKPMFLWLLLCWKQQGSGEKVRQVFRNLLERQWPNTLHLLRGLFLVTKYLLWWKDCTWLTWILLFPLKAIRVPKGNVIISHWISHLLVRGFIVTQQLVSDAKTTVHVLQPLNVAQNQHLWVFVHFHVFFVHILYAYVRWDVHVRTVCLLWFHFSLTAWAAKSCCSLCRVLSAAVPCHSVNKLAGWRRAGCLLVGYKLVAVNEGVWKWLHVLKWQSFLTEPVLSMSWQPPV